MILLYIVLGILFVFCGLLVWEISQIEKAMIQFKNKILEDSSRMLEIGMAVRSVIESMTPEAADKANEAYLRIREELQKVLNTPQK
jgi:hypothetical protein